MRQVLALERLGLPVLLGSAERLLFANQLALTALGYNSLLQLLSEKGLLSSVMRVEGSTRALSIEEMIDTPQVVNLLKFDGSSRLFTAYASHWEANEVVVVLSPLPSDQGPTMTKPERHSSLRELKANHELRALSKSLYPVILMRDEIITWINRAALETFGYAESSELEGKPLTTILQHSEAHTGELAQGVMGLRKDGVQVPVRISWSPSGEPGEYIGMLNSMADTLAREHAESERSDFRRVLETLSEPVIMMHGRHIVSVNAATLEAFGYDLKEELEGQPVTILMQPTEAQSHDAYVDRYEQTGERKIIGKPRVVTGRRKDGGAVSLTLSVSPCGKCGEYIGILYRRTEVEAREQAESERSDFRRVLETLSEPVIMMRGRHIVSVNAATLEAFGYDSKEELEGQPVTILMQPTEAQSHDAYVDRYEQTGERKIIGKPRVVVARRKDGSEVSLTLSVSPCATAGEYIAILYRRSDVEARIRAEAAEARAKVEAQLQAKVNELLESEIARLQLLIRSGGEKSNTELGISREPTLLAAWTGERSSPSMIQAKGVPESILSCLAVYVNGTGQITSCRWMHHGQAISHQATLTHGSHAFVKVLTEPFLRVSPVAHSFGKASGHPALANEQPVLYAGELEADGRGDILRWNNLSGTYRADDSMCFQTGLPLDRFWAVVNCNNPNEGESEHDKRYIRVHSGVLLRRVLSLSDAELEKVRSEWDTRVQSLCERDDMARRCFEEVQRSLDERCRAVSQYGYLTRVRDDAADSYSFPLNVHNTSGPPSRTSSVGGNLSEHAAGVPSSSTPSPVNSPRPTNHGVLLTTSHTAPSPSIQRALDRGM